MNHLTSSLDRIAAALARLGRTVVLNALQPGLPAAFVTSSLASVGLRPTSDVTEFFGWRNGTAEDIADLDGIQVFPGFYLLSLEEALTNYRVFLRGERWATGWLPILANGGGDFYAVDLSGGGAVHHFWIDEVEHPIEFSSLGQMMSTLAEAFERRVFYVDSSGNLEMDDLVFFALAAELNPEVAYWREP
jgi:hypothetical protein